MNVVDVPRPPAWLMEKGARDPRPVERASTRLRKLALRIGERTECHVVTGEPAAQIVAVARSIDAGLIVLTIKRSPSIFGPRQGTIAYRVLCEKAAPVLAIPGAGA
jgi:nucleotide-binding universal stress UspA family protein